MKVDILAGSTGVILQVFIRDSSSTTGAGLTGLTHSSAGLSAYYMRNSASADVLISLAGMTLGTYTSGGFAEIDSTNMPGWYQFCPPNAAVAASATSCVFHLFGAANMAPLPVEVQLVAYNPQDGVGLGLSGVTIGTQQILVKRDAALANFTFPMFSAGGSLVSGLTITAQRSINGGPFAACANSAAEIGSSGIYAINLANTDLNGTVICFEFTGSGANPTVYTVVTQA